MSEPNQQQQKQQTDNKSQKGKTPQRTPSNPFEGSMLFSSAPALPELPASNDVSSQVQPSSGTAGATEQQSALLYNTPAPPAYTLRAFEQRHDRQTIYIDARKAGALDALVQLVARKNKTDLFDEMVTDILAKHADVLSDNEEMVRLLEERYRIKHNL